MLALASYIAVHAEFRRRAAGLWLRHTIQVQRDLYQLYGLLQAAESGQRGYVITQDDRFVSLEAEAAASETTVEQLRTLILQLLTRFDEMVGRLYAMDLVIAGPEPFTPSPSSS